MFTRIVVGALLILGAHAAAFANATIPTTDIAGAKDNLLLKRYEGSFTQIAQLLKSNPKLAILVVGHTDNQGAYEYNIDLSRRRADAVVKSLAANHGVDAKRLRGAGVGMLAPAASNDSEEGRSKNRRVEIVKLN